MQERTNSRRKLQEYFERLFAESVDPRRPIKRLNIGFGDLLPEELATIDLFTDVEAEARERELQRAIIDVKGRYGKTHSSWGGACARGNGARAQRTGGRTPCVITWMHKRPRARSADGKRQTEGEQSGPVHALRRPRLLRARAAAGAHHRAPPRAHRGGGPGPFRTIMQVKRRSAARDLLRLGHLPHRVGHRRPHRLCVSANTDRKTVIGFDDILTIKR